MTARTVRCAVYCRKSSEEGLEQAFNSLDAQREAGQDYIKSQRHQGWVAIDTRYEDGGYSGGTTDRPGLQKLLADMRAGRIDVVVVYKVDRLSRSLADFARLMQLFDEHHAWFVSVTQQFSTTTSMGRLTLNMLLSFAQFEREVAGERIRDKIAATKRKGVWVCGQPPLGYRMPKEGDPGYVAGDRVLRVVPTEAALVRAVYTGYLQLGSPIELAAKLSAAGHTTKKWTSSRGILHGGRPLTAALVYKLLTNPVYVGKITHTRAVTSDAGRSESRTELYEGLHEPIISQTLWDQVQAQMTTAKRQPRTGWTHSHLLQGKLQTFEGHAMSPGSVQRPVTEEGRSTGQRRVVRYYVSQKAIKQGYKACAIKTINAAFLDDLVRSLVADHLCAQHGFELATLDAASRDGRLRDVTKRVVLGSDRLSIELSRDRLEAMADELRHSHPTPSSRTPRSGASVENKCPITPACEERGNLLVLSIPIAIKKVDGKRLLIGPDGRSLLSSVDLNGQPVPRQHIVRAIGQAFAWKRQLESNGGTHREVGRHSGVCGTRVRALLALTHLAPAALRGALNGTLPESVSLEDLGLAAQHLDWGAQHCALRL
ncbi:MAG: recombinase family protein [Phycisphaerales bacterium]|nr:recombinase family protein [Phycisphaerales bacterium]